MTYALSPCKRYVTVFRQRLSLVEAAEQVDGHRADAERHRKHGSMRAAALHLKQAARLEALVREGQALRGARAQ